MKIVSYLTIMFSIFLVLPLVGFETAGFRVLKFFMNSDFTIVGLFTSPIFLTLVAVLGAFGIATIFIGTTFRIPLELIALISYTALLIPLGMDLMSVNDYIISECSTGAQLGCFGERIVNLFSFVLFAGFLHSCISWWAGRAH